MKENITTIKKEFIKILKNGGFEEELAWSRLTQGKEFISFYKRVLFNFEI